MRTERIRTGTLAFILAAFTGAPAWGQDAAAGAARLAGAGRDVRIERDGAEVAAGAALQAGDRVRVGPASFAELSAGAGVRFILGPGASAVLTSPESPPSLRLEDGPLRVITRFEAVRIESAAGAFVLSGIPGEASFEAAGSRLTLRVRTGEMTAEEMSPEALVRIGPPHRAARVLTAGFTEGFKAGSPLAPGWIPNVYVGYPASYAPDYRRGRVRLPLPAR